MKKLLFVVALLSTATTIVNAMTSSLGQETDARRNLTRPVSNVTGADEDEVTGQENDAVTQENDEVTGEEQEVTQTEENGY